MVQNFKLHNKMAFICCKHDVCTIATIFIDSKSVIRYTILGTPINKGPSIGTKDLNLYKLFKVVQKCGGYNRVNKTYFII